MELKEFSQGVLRIGEYLCERVMSLAPWSFNSLMPRFEYLSKINFTNANTNR